MLTLKELTTDQNNELYRAWKRVDILMAPLHDDHRDTLEARDRAEVAWDDFFSLCDTYATDRISAYFYYSLFTT